jgi:hypothetical protein
MAINFASATGNLFNRMGKIGLLLKQIKSYQTTQQTNFTDQTNGVVAQYNAESDIQGIAGQNWITNVDSAGTIVGSLASNMAQQTVNRIVFRDTPRITQTLTQLNVVDSLREIIRQMISQGATIQQATVSATAGTASGTGNGIINVSVRRPLDGLLQENLFAETLKVVCTSDSYVGGATLANEGFTVLGTGAQSNYFAHDWPLGSNCRAGLSAIDGNTNNGSGNILTNWFTTFNSVANTPDNFTVATGAAGTNFFQESSIIYDGTGALRVAGDAALTKTSLVQTLNSSSGSAGTLSPLTQYSFNIWVRRDGTAAAAGTATIDLIDGSSATINDANSQANSFNIDLTALTTSYVNYTGIFRTPVSLPSTYQVRIRLSTALTNGRSVYFAKGSLGTMTRCYVGGPYIAIHSGSTAFVATTSPYSKGDFFAPVLANNRGGAADGVSSFGPLFARTLPMQQSDLLLPSASSPSISDGLIG